MVDVVGVISNISECQESNLLWFPAAQQQFSGIAVNWIDQGCEWAVVDACYGYANSQRSSGTYRVFARSREHLFVRFLAGGQMVAPWDLSVHM